MNTTELIKLLQKVNIKSAFRQDTATNWEIANPVLGSGEPGYVLDSDGLFKIGDGKTPWNSLRYANSNENHVTEVQPNGNYYVRRKESPNKPGEWVELKDFNNILRDVSDEQTYIRKNNEWVLFDESTKADKFEIFDYVSINKKSLPWVTTLKIKAKEVEATEDILFTAVTDDMLGMETTFKLRYTIDGKIQLLNQADVAQHTLYENGKFAYVKGEIVGILFEFDYKTQIITFKKKVLLTKVSDELIDSVLVEGERTLNLKDVYDSIIVDEKVTIEDLYARPFGQEVKMQYDFVNELGIAEEVYGYKLFKETVDVDSSEVLSSINSIVRVEGTYQLDGKTKYISCNDVSLFINESNNLILTKTNKDLDISNIKLVILYTK